MEGESMNVVDEKMEQLKALLPEVFSEGRIDWEKLRLALGGDVNISDERYVLNWAGKADAYRTLQSPTTATLAPDKEESVNFEDTENIFIEGENLEVLKVLQKAYYGKIKMIYIDPPFNTGNDSFIYPDKFSESREEYLKRIQSKDKEGFLIREGLFRQNSKDSGHFHSNWLSMMYPRLFLARNVLKEDGLIFVSIDDNEVFNLRLLMNDVFGEENFLATFVWKRRASSALAQDLVSTDHEYVVAYRKSDKFQGFLGRKKDYSGYSNPDDDPNGPWTPGDLTVGMTKDQRPNQFYNLVDPETGIEYPPNPNRVWAYIPETMKIEIEEGRVIFPDDPARRPMQKRYKRQLKSKVNPVSTWIKMVSDKEENPDGIDVLESGLTSEGTKTLQDLFGTSVFNYSKPVSLLKSIIKFTTQNNDAILDFFAGSASTAQGIIEANIEDNEKRKFIMVQFPEDVEGDTFHTISEIGRERIRRVIEKINKNNPMFAENGHDLGFRAFKLVSTNFKLWRGDGIKSEEDLAQQLDLLEDPVRGEAREENMLFELLLKSGYPLTTQIEKREVDSSYYYLVDEELAIALNHLDEVIVEDMLEASTQQVICLDSLFEDDDAFKTNTKLQFKDAGIAFHSI